MVGTLATADSARRHAAAVATLQQSYGAIPAEVPVRLAKSTSNLFRRRTSAPTVGLDVAALNQVIQVDEAARTADVEGMCTYEDLVAATLPHGLMPLVVPQLKTITLGGAVSGLGIESTSFRNGLPHESVLEMDILTGDGDDRHLPAGRAARRPVRHLPQLLRQPRLRGAAAHRARAGLAVRRAPACPVQRPRRARRRDQHRVSGGQLGRRTGRLRRRRRLRARPRPT